MAGEKANGEHMKQLVEEEDMPPWLHVLLRTRFWEPCSRGHAEENRAEDCMFCLHCYEVFCPHCTHDMPNHRVLKVRRYVYRSVVLVKDMQELKTDVSRIQPYIINGQKGIHLRPLKRSCYFRPSAGAPPCKTCGCWLRCTPNIFCSLTCKEKADVSSDDFSGPEAEHRYKSIQKHHLAHAHPVETNEQHQPAAEPDQGVEAGLQPQPVEPDHGVEAGLHHQPAEPDHGAEAEAEPAALDLAEETLVVNTLELLQENMRSFRTRPRKQGKPQRAPFF
ncbi:hypothetical protein QOZ80_5AG0392710 [Eleusine coracana subsp. coracana]|nr:hypothetical protein QOZ80_5AG0392710 [Eleusine coracana subsp. coracana]